MAIEEAIKLIETACVTWSLGYDQSNRLDFRDGGETDCSALVIITCENTGLLPGNDIRKGIGATFTGNMRSGFQIRGWEVLPNLPVAQLQPGDVLLKDGEHTAMYVGSSDIAQASIDEHGNPTGGTFGDLTGRETAVRSYYDFPWSCVLRFPGTPAPIPSPKDEVMSPITLTVTADGTFRAAAMAEAGSSSAVVDAAWITWGSTFGATEFNVSCLDEAGNVMQNGKHAGVLANNRRAFMELPSGVVMAVVEGRVIDRGAVPAAALVTKAR